MEKCARRGRLRPEIAGIAALGGSFGLRGVETAAKSAASGGCCARHGLVVTFSDFP